MMEETGSMRIAIREQPAIPTREYSERIERLIKGMREQNLDAALIGTGMNLQYFSGFPSPAKNVARPFFLLIPTRAEPVLFSHIAFAEECRHLSTIVDVRPYEVLSQVPVDVLKSALREVGVGTGRIGMELGFEQSLDISHLDFQRFQKAIGSAELEDISGLLWQLRMIKSEAEIDCIRYACELTAAAYATTFAGSRAGMNERSIFEMMQHELHKSGGETFLVITSGEGNYDMISKPADDRIVRAGEMVWMDAGCRVGGYWSDFSRGGVVGTPSSLQEQSQSAIMKVTADTVAQIRPGKRCSEIARFALDRLDQLEFPITSSLALRAGRIGHGIGLNMTEPPHLGLHDDTVMQPGMVVSVEPGIATRWGTFHVEENIVVREGGNELLSKSHRTLQTIAL